MKIKEYIWPNLGSILLKINNAALYGSLLLGLIGLGIGAFISYRQDWDQPCVALSKEGESKTLSCNDSGTISSQALLSWATMAATASYTYNFVNYNQSIERTRNYFTSGCYEVFSQAMSQILTQVESNNLEVSAVATNTATIINEGFWGGRYAWQVQVPILVDYRTADQKQQKQLLINMLIRKVAVSEAPSGLGIDDFTQISM